MLEGIFAAAPSCRTSHVAPQSGAFPHNCRKSPCSGMPAPLGGPLPVPIAAGIDLGVIVPSRIINTQAGTGLEQCRILAVGEMRIFYAKYSGLEAGRMPFTSRQSVGKIMRCFVLFRCSKKIYFTGFTVALEAERDSLSQWDTLARSLSQSGPLPGHGRFSVAVLSPVAAEVLGVSAGASAVDGVFFSFYSLGMRICYSCRQVFFYEHCG